MPDEPQGLPAGEFDRRFIFRDRSAVIFLRDDDIHRIEANGDYLRFHTEATTHQARMTMKEVERRLDPSKFIRIHRSAIVNLDRVDKFCFLVPGQRAAVMRDGTRLKLGNRYRGVVKQLLTKAN